MIPKVGIYENKAWRFPKQNSEIWWIKLSAHSDAMISVNE